jgi:zinc/manganese transport system permease protein
MARSSERQERSRVNEDGLLTLLQVSLNPITGLQEMLGNDFMRYAFMAGTSMAVLGGLVGYFVVLRRLAFAGEALSHVAFAAALGAVLLGFEPLAGMFVITVAVALGMGSFADQARSNDIAVGTVLTWVLGVGALFLSIYTSSASGGNNGQIGVNVLFGSILGVQLQQAQEAVGIGLVALVVLLLIIRPLLFATLDPTIAQVRGVPVRLVGIAFIGLVAVTVTEAVQVVGALLVLALLVMPAATAQRWTSRPFIALVLSAALAVLLTWSGLILGYYKPYPVSFFITTLAFGSYAGTLGVQYAWSRWSRRPAGHVQIAGP